MVMTEKELEIENLELRLEIGLLEKKNDDLFYEIYSLRSEMGLKAPEYQYKSRKQELKEFLASKLDSRIVDLRCTYQC
jgi:hypothetical protein